MFIDDIFAQYGIKSNIDAEKSASVRYDNTINLLSYTFKCEGFTALQKKNLYLDIKAFYGQL